MKKKIDLGITVEDVLKFFWLAKENGWASGKADVKKDRFNPNLKRIVFQQERFFYRDEYWVTPASDSSTGTTTILFLYNKIWIPVWWMSYRGEYPKEVISFLKEALLFNIEQKKFEGGRGPLYFNRHSRRKDLIIDYSYTNKPVGNFNDFSGKERITTSDGMIGYHRYEGMSLL